MKGILCIFGFYKNDNLKKSEKLKRRVYEIRDDFTYNESRSRVANRERENSGAMDSSFHSEFD